MSARFTAAQVQECLRSAFKQVVGQMGTGPAADELGVDPKTLRRHRDEGGWSDAELARLIAYELQEHGASTVIARLAEMHARRPTGQAVAVQGGLLQELADNAQVSAEVVRALRDGRISATERAKVREVIAERRLHEDQLLADLDAAEGRA